MSKTPEELAEEYAQTIETCCGTSDIIIAAETAFLAGYKAAQDQVLARFKSLLSSFAETSFNPNHTAWQIFDTLNENQAAQDQVADADKVMPEWISVKDRLPEYDQLALLWQSEMQAQFVGRRRDSGLAFPLYYWECTEDFFEAWKEIYFPKLMHQGVVTHWMPLPAPPKEDK